MPTDLPPDYKPRPKDDPASPVVPDVPGSAPAYPPELGEDARDPTGGDVEPGADVLDPVGWHRPGRPADEQPLPAGAPIF